MSNYTKFDFANIYKKSPKYKEFDFYGKTFKVKNGTTNILLIDKYNENKYILQAKSQELQEMVEEYDEEYGEDIPEEIVKKIKKLSNECITETYEHKQNVMVLLERLLGEEQYKYLEEIDPSFEECLLLVDFISNLLQNKTAKELVSAILEAQEKTEEKKENDKEEEMGE